MYHPYPTKKTLSVLHVRVPEEELEFLKKHKVDIPAFIRRAVSQGVRRIQRDAKELK